MPDEASRVHLGPTPRPALVRFLRDDGSSSAAYIAEARDFDIPDGVAAVEISQMPLYPRDYPAGDEPGWGNDDDRRAHVAQDLRPEDGSVTRVEVRGPEHFRRSR